MPVTARRTVTLFLLLLLPAIIGAQPTAAVDDSAELYTELKAFRLGSGPVHVENFTLDRDALRLSLTGDVYLAEKVNGGVYGAVFIGQGRVTSTPRTLWEEQSVSRFLNAKALDATFSKAVLRFTDDTAAKFAGMPPASDVYRTEAQRMATNLSAHITTELGLNLEARILQSLMNQEHPGMFFFEAEGGNRGRFGAVVDYQMRIPATIFGINGGEKGVVFKYESSEYATDAWMAFYSDEDYRRGMAGYADAFDVISIPDYRLEVDLRDPGNWLRMQAQMDITSLVDGVRVIPLLLNDGLSERDNVRRDKGIRVLSGEIEGRGEVGIIQEPWESGFSVVLPWALAKGEKARLTLKMEGKDSLWSWGTKFHYPRSTTSWYPRHGYLSRSVFNIVFRHDKNTRVASIGKRIREGAIQGNEWETEWLAEDPVALITFVCGPFERHAEKVDVGGKKIPVEYYSPPSSMAAVKEDFILAEVGNAVRYFDNIFGEYPYGRIGSAFFPTSYGQGFPSLLLLPVKGTADRDEFAFLAHENAHQWWGNIVGWRSYRDQWLSEGFAEYSGVLYTGLRNNKKSAEDLIKLMRLELLDVPTTNKGVARTKLHETGPLTLGTRLASTKSFEGYQLVYSKGALVLRMLHFLLSNPERPSDDAAFFAMMKDFTERHRNSVATTESFMRVAGEHFARSPIGQRYGLKDLNWFLSQWVYQTALPTYHFDYSVETSDRGIILHGTVLQDKAPENWIMILPITMEFAGGKVARTTVHANGPKTEIRMALPEKPQRVRLDPDLWVLSEKTSEKAN